MMTVHYTGGTVMMANDVCDALLHYASVLAKAQGSDVLMVPVVSDDGVVTTAEFLIGPSSQLLAVPIVGADESGRDQDVIDDINRRADMIDSPIAVVGHEPDSAPFDHDRS